ncbi:MAG TPA: phage holin family protein [Myxococcales bacterium]
MANSDPHAAVSPRDALTRLLDGVQRLFREHLALAKTELKDDLRRAGRDLLLSAAGLPPLLVGYVLLMVCLRARRAPRPTWGRAAPAARRGSPSRAPPRRLMASP